MRKNPEFEKEKQNERKGRSANGRLGMRMLLDADALAEKDEEDLNWASNEAVVLTGGHSG